MKNFLKDNLDTIDLINSQMIICSFSHPMVEKIFLEENSLNVLKMLLFGEWRIDNLDLRKTIILKYKNKFRIITPYKAGKIYLSKKEFKINYIKQKIKKCI